MTDQYSISQNDNAKVFLSKSVFIPVKTVLFKEVTVEFEGMKSNPNFYIKSVMLTELKKQQSDRFYNFKTYCVQSKL